MLQWLSYITIVVNLAALTVCLWLGLYLVTRSFHSRTAWLAAITVWSVASWFLRNVLQSSLPMQEELRWIGWIGQGVKFAPILWFHLSWWLREEAGEQGPVLRYGSRLALSIGYALAFFQILLSELYAGVQPVTEGGVARFADMWVTPSFSLFLGLLVLFPLVAGINFYLLRVRTRSRLLRRQYHNLFLATCVAYVGGLYTGFGAYLQLPLPTVPADAILGASIVLIGYTVAEYNALLEARPMARDARYSIVGIGLVTLIYLLVVLFLRRQGEVSFFAAIMILVAAVITHALYDGGRTMLDRLFYRGAFRQLRAGLRRLAVEAGSGETLPQQLALVLATLRHTLEVPHGFIAVRHADNFVVAAASDVAWREQLIPHQALAATEVIEPVQLSGVKLKDANLPQLALLVPLYAGQEQIGALVLGSRGDHTVFQPEDLDYLDTLANQLAVMIQLAQHQEAQASALDQTVNGFLQRERKLQQQLQEILANRIEAPPEPGGLSEPEVVPLVEDALRHLRDFDYLGENPLARWQITSRQLAGRAAPDGQAVITHVEQGKALHQVLMQAVHQLRPAENEPSKNEPPSREWYAYVILHDSYVLGELNRDIMSRLYIGEGTYNRTRRRALRSVAKILLDMERAIQ
jgi:hypothetical protein